VVIIVINLLPIKKQQMLIKTIINNCHKFTSFSDQHLKLATSSKTCHAPLLLLPSAGAQLRLVEWATFWIRSNMGIRFFLLYFLRRVECGRCRVKVEQAPRAQAKKELTTTSMQYLAFRPKKFPGRRLRGYSKRPGIKSFHACST